MKHIFFIFFILTLTAIGARGSDPPFTIKLNNDAPVQYCADSAPVAEFLTIEGSPNIKVMKISITEGFIASEDILDYTGTLTQSSPSLGTLVLTGGTSTQDFVNAIHYVSYKNSKSVPTLGARKITISLSEVAGDPLDYSPATGHFYQFIHSPGITWTEAKDGASSDARMYYGFRGYLATITSQAENDFIKTKTDGMGWIGANDAVVEGEWRWVTGPEGLQDGGKGLLFWLGTGYDAKRNPSAYGAVKDVNGVPAYQNWNRWDTPYSSSTASNTWEPNQSGIENYAHITVFSGNSNDSYKWNDLPNAGNAAGTDYYPTGYIIEYGGMPGDPVSNLTATLELQVNTMLFANTGTLAAICEGNSVTLNQTDATSATYSWTPSGSLSSSLVPNPVATPSISTTYTVTGTRGTCTSTATYTVPVIPKPISLLKVVENICKGDKITLDPGEHQSYYWSNGATTRTITVDTAGEYVVTLTMDMGCAAQFKSNVVVHDYPTIDLSNIQSLICGDAKATTVAITTNAFDYSLTSADNKAIIADLNVTVPDFGVYSMIYKASFYPSCPVTKNFDLSFYGIPKVGLTIDSTKCYRYNIDVAYDGDADPVISNFTWIFGGDTIANGIGEAQENIPLGINQSKRDLVLKVEQNGCSNDHTITDIKVIPTLSLSVKDTIRCQPDLFQFSASNTETGVKYDWDFGDGNKGTGNVASHQYSLSGKYDIQLTVTTDKMCTNSVLMKDGVFAAPIPDMAFSLSPGECLNPGINEISYTGVIGTVRDKYNWDLSQFDPSEIIKDPLQTQGPFRFDLKNKPSTTLGLTVISEFNCKSETGSITLKRKPDFKMTSDLSMDCIPFEPALSGIINDPVDKVDFIWDFGDGSTTAGSNVTHIYNQPGKNYNISLTGTSSLTGCQNSLINNNFLSTYPKPTAAFSMDNNIVYNDKPDVKFTDNSEGATEFLWDFGDGTSTTVENPSHRFVDMGHKKILLQAFNEFTCSDTTSHDLLVAFSKIFPPNAFSPNAPNAVDREFRLSSEGMKEEGYHLVILSRWNDIVFETKNGISGWDGHMKNGSFAPAGSYIWILNFTDFLGRRHRQTGTVSVVY